MFIIEYDSFYSINEKSSSYLLLINPVDETPSGVMTCPADPASGGGGRHLRGVAKSAYMWDIFCKISQSTGKNLRLRWNLTLFLDFLLDFGTFARSL